MSYRILDLSNFPRRAHFDYFRAMANPYVGVTVQVDITAFQAARRERKLPFFLPFLYCIGQAANRVPQLRQRIVGEEIWEFDQCDTSHTVLCSDETYSYCQLNCNVDFDVFFPEASRLHAEAKEHPTLDDGEDGVSLLFVSCLPWLSYTALQQPTPVPADSNPRITWGKFVEEGGRCTLPVTLLAHHALVDGSHMGAFYQELQGQLKQFGK